MTNPMRDPISDRWEEVDRIYGAALDLAVADREAYLTEACAGDTVLFDTVSRLLAASGKAEEALSQPHEEVLLAAFARNDTAGSPGAGRPSDDERIPTRGLELGAYRLIREIKSGGMASVYEAERADGAFTRRVAIKMLRGVRSSELTRRFLAERQILSELVHPHIASILDGGADGDGQPYLVLEWIDGASITRWADERRLGVAERLALVCQVAGAVQYAHTRLVVHRDIKPSNVLVDGEGHVRLLDFGIAKLLDTVGDDDSGPRTATRWMTPEYAAPEQIMGQSITTATDVHALGILLHELLTGRRPFTAGSAGLSLEQAICEQAPQPMSTLISDADADIALARSTTPRSLRRTLAGDLDAIVSKALRKRPDERYQSASALADDLQRYADGVPVQARAGLRLYRVRKYLRRHWAGVTIAAITFVMVTVSGALLSRERDAAIRARTQAETEADNGQLVIEFLADVFRGRDPSQAPGDTITARELLIWGTERVETEFAGRPAVHADLLLVLGRAYRNLGFIDESIDLFSRAVDLERSVNGDGTEEFARALSELAISYAEERDFAAAARLRREALRVRRALPDADRSQLANTTRLLGETLRELGQVDSAEILVREALAIRRGLPLDSAGLASDLLGLAFVLRAKNRLDEAARLYEEGIPVYRSLPDRSDQFLSAHLNNLGYLYRVRGDYAAAEPLYREAHSLSAEILGPAHPQSLAFAGNLASVVFEQGRFDDAADIMRARIAATREQWPDGHWRVASAYGGLAHLLLRAGDPAGAAINARASAAEYERTLGADNLRTVFGHALVAVTDLLSGELAAGQIGLDRLHARLADQRMRNGGSLDLETAQSLEPFVNVLEAVGLEEEQRRFAALLARL